jgi:hypothetical protein
MDVCEFLINYMISGSRKAWKHYRNAFNAQIQVFIVIRNKNTFIAFLTFSDIYVCFTLSTLQTMVQHILDAGDIPVTTW